MASLRVAHLATNRWRPRAATCKAQPVGEVAPAVAPVGPVRSAWQRRHSSFHWSCKLTCETMWNDMKPVPTTWSSLRQVIIATRGECVRFAGEKAHVWSLEMCRSSLPLPPGMKSVEFEGFNTMSTTKRTSHDKCYDKPGFPKPGFPCLWLRRAMWSSWPGWWVQS